MNDDVKDKKKRLIENHHIYRSVDYSGFFERLFARTIDLIIIIAIGYVFYKRFGLLQSVIYTALIDLIFRILMTYFLGTTVGKFIFGVRVISRCSAKLSIGQVIIREVFKFISAVILEFGYLSIGVSHRKKAWHDIAACTAVTSGGKSEAEYASQIYGERPEKWHPLISIVISVIIITASIVCLNKGALYLLYDKGLIGYTKNDVYIDEEYEYGLPQNMEGNIALNKNVIQIGDTDGDGGFEIFREGIKENKPFITNMRFLNTKTIDGDIKVSLDKPIIQYRLLDINGDKKDELAVLFEDRTIKIYKMQGGATEIASYGPIEYKEITGFIKGRNSGSLPYELYIMGDNKLTALAMKDEKIENKKYDLPSTTKLINLNSGTFQGKNYIVASSDDGKLNFFEQEDNEYRSTKSLNIPIKGNVFVNIFDINSDGKNEVVLTSVQNESRPYPVIAAYDVSGEKMKLVWDGGKFYNYNNKKYTLFIDAVADADKNKKLDLYMVSKKVSDKEGNYSLFIFEINKPFIIANDFLRALGMTKPK